MKPIAVIDSETDPFVYGRIPQPFIWGYYNGTTFKTFYTTDSLIQYIRTRDEYIYAHNGGKFDFHYLLPFVTSDTGTIDRSLIINGRIVEFRIGKATLRDSFAILPIALSNYKKDEIDYALFEKGIREKHMDSIISYLRGDCVYLYEMVTGFLNEFGNKRTLASAGFAKAKQVDRIANFSTNRFFYQLFKPYYHGGRVSMFYKGIIKTRTYIYDINSAYPYAMLHTHPFGNKVHVTSNKSTKISELSFYRIEGISRGIFPYIDEKLHYPNDDSVKEYCVTGYELKAALETQSFDGRILKEIQFNEHISFVDYISHYYKQKSSHKKGTIPYILAKLAMNSVYGKLGANPDKYLDYIICAPKDASRIMSEQGAMLAYLGERYTLLAIPIPDIRKRFYNVATASSITGFVRARLWRAIQRVKADGYNVYYCDTDSLITNHPSLPTSKEIGGWDLEQTNDLLYLYAPKIYAARNAITKKWKVASKGVDLEPTDILKLLNGKSVRWENPAPTFKVKADTTFIHRELRG